MKNHIKSLQPGSIEKRRNLLFRVSVSAVFLSFALLLKTLTSFYLPILGAAGLKVDFSGIFTAFPALLFGPFYGGAVCALADLLGYLLKPSGAFIPLLTVTAFASGFLIGLFWKITVKNIKKNNKIAAYTVAVFFILLGIFGVTLHVSLNTDGIINGLTADENQLPSRGRLETEEMSVLSRFVCSIARYSNDTITVTKVNPNTLIAVIPAEYEVEGYPYKITHIASHAFSDNITLRSIFLSSNITSIDNEAFAGTKDITIYAPAECYAAVFASENGFSYQQSDFDSFMNKFGHADVNSSVESYEITNKYRQNLAGYINFLSIGFELISLFVLSIISISIFITTRKIKKADDGASALSREGSYIRVLLSVFIPRLLITTINTEILRQYFAVWNGRAFIILWIPRAAEEILVGIIQAYIIMLLYALYETKLKKKPLTIKNVTHKIG